MPSAFGVSDSQTLTCDFCRVETKLKTNDLFSTGLASLQQVTIGGSLTLGGTTFNEEQVQNLIKHSNNTENMYLTGDPIGVLPSDFNAHVTEYNVEKDKIASHRAELDVLDVSRNLTLQNADDILDMKVKIFDLENANNTAPNFPAIFGMETLTPALGLMTLHEFLGDISSTPLTTAISNVDAKVDLLTEHFNLYKSDVIGEILNDGTAGSNVYFNSTLMGSIGDLDQYSSDNSLISQYNVTKTTLQQTVAQVSTLVDDMEEVQNDIALLKMSEGGGIGDISSIHELVGDISTSSKEGWYPIFDNASLANDWITVNIETPILDHFINHAITPSNYSDMFQKMTSYKVVEVGPSGGDIDVEWAEDNSNYFTVLVDNNGTWEPSDGLLPINGIDKDVLPRTYNGNYTRNVSTLLESMENEINDIKQTLGPTNIVSNLVEKEESINYASNFLYNSILMNYMPVSMFRTSSNHWGTQILFGQSNQLTFSSGENEKVCKVEGKTDQNNISVQRSLQHGQLCFTLMLGPIGNQYGFDLMFHLNDSSNVYFGVEFRWLAGDAHYAKIIQQNSEQVYQQFENASSDTSQMFRSNPVHYMQLRYNYNSERFTGINTCRNFGGEDLLKQWEGNYSKVDKEFVFDWIASKTKRLRFVHSQHTYEIELLGMIVHTI